MAKVKLNPVFMSIDGKIGRLVHFNRYGRQYCRVHVVPANPRTKCQQAVRNIFAEAVRSWRELSPETQGEYNRRARYMPLSGYNLYVGGYMKRNIIINTESVRKAEISAGILAIPSRYSHKGTVLHHSLTAPFQLLYSINTGPVQAGCTPGPYI